MMYAAHRIALISAVLGAIELAQGQALTGLVRSAEEGPMEGVLVGAQRANTPVTITVLTDASGRYTFPRIRLDPGRYTLRIRAMGYDLANPESDPGPVDVALNKTASADLKLAKTRDLASQLSNAEWLLSMPGPDDQKGSLLNCVNCHRLDFITRSHHTPAEFIQVMERMSTYANQSTPLKPQRREARATTSTTSFPTRTTTPTSPTFTPNTSGVLTLSGEDQSVPDSHPRFRFAPCSNGCRGPALDRRIPRSIHIESRAT